MAKKRKRKCPRCKIGNLHPVKDTDSSETYYHCDTCLASMDSSGGYTY
jgi:phage FluMu protein Com